MSAVQRALDSSIRSYLRGGPKTTAQIVSWISRHKNGADFTEAEINNCLGRLDLGGWIRCLSDHGPSPVWAVSL